MNTLKIGSVLSDSLKYPFTDIKRLVILGIILFFGDIYSIFNSYVNSSVISIIMVIGFLFIILSYGYGIRIIRTTLDGADHLPPFTEILKIFKDGIKVFVVLFVYYVPFIVVMVLSFIALTLDNNNLNPQLFLLLLLFTLCYNIIVLSLVLLAYANMAKGDKLGDAFKIRNIINIITRIGLGSYIIWYITVGIISLFLIFVGSLIAGSLRFTDFMVIGIILYSLIISYSNIFIFRSVALVYESGGRDILKCGKCEESYELDEGERAEDFESCQCGGELKQTKKYG